MPASVTTIGANAFQKCSLYCMTFAEDSKLTYIGNYVFAESFGLLDMYIPTNIKSIGNYAFADCKKLKTVIIGTNVTNISNSAFAGCDNLTIYTSWETPPSGWVGGWNSSNRPVVLGYHYDNTISCYTFTKSNSNPYNMNAENGVSNPPHHSYQLYNRDCTFDGWYTTPDFSGTAYPDIPSAPSGALYPHWTEKNLV